MTKLRYQVDEANLIIGGAEGVGKYDFIKPNYKNVLYLARTFWFKALASFLIVSLGASVFYLTSALSEEDQWITRNSNNKISHFPLVGGGTVILNANSEIHYHRTFPVGIRAVTLSRDAFFDLTGSAGNPLAVACDDLSISAQSAAFGVNNFSDSPIITAKVVRGKVVMSNLNDSIVIGPGQTGVYHKKSKMFELSPTKTENDLGYATHTFTFVNVSMKEVVAYLSRSFNVTFVLANGNINNCRLSFTCKDKPLSFIMDRLAESLTIGFDIKDNVVYISGDGCI